MAYLVNERTANGLGAPPGIDLAKAVRLNAFYASTETMVSGGKTVQGIGWGPFRPRMEALFGLPAGSDDQSFALAAARWQASQGLTADGIIGPNTWAKVLPAFARPPATGAATWDAKAPAAVVVWKGLIQKAAKTYGVPEALIAAVIMQESGGFNQVSSTGDVGLMQINIKAHNLRHEDAIRPDFNIDYGTRFLAYLIKRFGDLPKAVQAYNFGEGNVKKLVSQYGSQWMNYRYTIRGGDKQYFENVMRYYIPWSSAAPTTTPTTTPSTPPASGGCPIAPLTPLTGAALKMEQGQKVLWENVDPRLIAGRDRLEALLKQKGWTLRYASAFRPNEYQNHFWEIFSKLQDPAINQSACATLKAQLEAERAKHGLQGRVAKPDGSGPHVRGVAFDARVYDENGRVLNENGNVDARLVELARQAGLRMPYPDNDAVHFQL